MGEGRGLLRQLGRVLKTRDEDITQEPLPERWVEIVRALDERERRKRAEESEKK
jgi:hypothetical protein